MLKYLFDWSWIRQNPRVCKYCMYFCITVHFNSPYQSWVSLLEFSSAILLGATFDSPAFGVFNSSWRTNQYFHVIFYILSIFSRVEAGKRPKGAADCRHVSQKILIWKILLQNKPIFRVSMYKRRKWFPWKTNLGQSRINRSSFFVAGVEQ